MPIEATPKGADRAPAAKVICDDCGETELVRADYERIGPGNFVLNEGQVIQKLSHHGWTYVKRKVRCPSCEAARRAAKPKEVTMPKSMEEQLSNVVAITPSSDELRQPTREQKRQIITLLNDVYDTGAGRFIGGETDKTVADAIGGGVLLGWVAQIREDLFGPAGGNEDLEELERAVRSHEDAINSMSRELAAYGKLLTEGQNAISAMRVSQADLQRRVEGLKASIGPRARNVQPLGVIEN